MNFRPRKRPRRPSGAVFRLPATGRAVPNNPRHAENLCGRGAPRRIMFEFEKPRVTSWVWRWLAPMAASAAVALAVVSLAPRQQPQPQIVERVVEKQVVTQSQPSAAEPVDYQKIQAWLTTELNKRDRQAKELMRVRGDLALLDSYQRAVEKETWNNASSIQLLASKTKDQEKLWQEFCFACSCLAPRLWPDAR